MTPRVESAEKLTTAYGTALMSWRVKSTSALPFASDIDLFGYGKSIIDLVADDLNTLEGFNMSKADYNKLEAWKALLSDAGAMVAASAQCTSATATRRSSARASPC